jgi:hypothetical protein
MKIKINKEKRNLKLITNTIKYIEKTNEYKGNIKIKKYVIKQSKKSPLEQGPKQSIIYQKTSHG